jgi:copper homeostasis protein
LKPTLEIACFNFESAIIAERGGADRIELCEDFFNGGISPPPELYIKVKKNLKIPVFVMIRPRSGNFVYSDVEFMKMKKEIISFKELGAEGFVFGILKENGEIDINRNTELVRLASPLSCTFHRAFDCAPDPLKSMEDIITCGFSRILTSGSQKTALNGISILSELIKNSHARIIIMPGGGIRSQNIIQIRETTGAFELHSSGIIEGEVADLNEIRSLNQKIK